MSGISVPSNESTVDQDGEDKQMVIKVLMELDVQNVNEKVKKVFRRGRATDKNKSPPLVVELNDKTTQQLIIASAKNLKNSENYSNVFINPDLTRHEIEVERELRRRRNEANGKLEFGNGKMRHGKTQDGVEFYWGIRYGRLCRINRSTKRIISSQ